ncbi:MAG: glycoside hydrolase family protein [Chloroflexota bacterium]|nr:glycoside hydrolase family protein [Chloroflexota bacterium]
MSADHRREEAHASHAPQRRESEAGAARHESAPTVESAPSPAQLLAGLGARGNGAANAANIQRMQSTYGNQATRALVQRLTLSRAAAPPAAPAVETVAPAAVQDPKLQALLEKLTKQSQELAQESGQLRAENAQLAALAARNRQLEAEIHATLGEIQAATQPATGPTAPTQQTGGVTAPPNTAHGSTPAVTPAHHTAPIVEPEALVPAVHETGTSPTVARRLEMRRQMAELNRQIAQLQHVGGSQAQIVELRHKKAALAHALLATAHEYKQFDSRWGGKQYGTNTITGSGCGPTSLAIVLNYLNQEDPEHPKEIRPDETAGYSLAAGARVPNVGTSGPTMISHLDKKDWHQFHGERFHGQQITLSQAVSELGNGNPVIFSGSNIRGTRHDGKLSKPYKGHFMVLSGVNEGGTVFNVLDPGRREATDIETITHQELAHHANGFYVVQRAGGHGTPGPQTAGQAEQTGGTHAGGHSGGTHSGGHKGSPHTNGQPTGTPQTAPTGTPDTGGRQLSHNGVQLIASFEGFDAHLYNDSAGHATIGYGTLVHRGPVNGSESAEFKHGITRERALELLLHETAGDARTINSHIHVPLNQDQFDALVSFAYNVGPGGITDSTLGRVLNAGHYDQVPAQMERWNKAGGKVSKGLTTRRAEEAALFSRGTAAMGHTAPAPVAANGTGGAQAPAGSGHSGGTHAGGTHAGGTHAGGTPAGGTHTGQLSGAEWVARYPTSRSTDTLHEPFKAHVDSFIHTMRAGGATISISATYRPVERAYLMHYAWEIAHGHIAYGHYPTTDPHGIGINWDHGSAAASQTAAQAMVNGYGMAYTAALQSHHTQGRAIDMNISNLPDSLTLPNGTSVHIGGGGGQNHTLWQVGAEHFGVHKLASDPPHWSDDGH